MKEVVWVGDSRERLRRFPKEARQTIGKALQYAQLGDKHPTAKPMQGLGTGVLQIVARLSTNAYRAVYTVSIRERVYVLHCFEKKSTRGIRTPKREIDLIKQRLKRAKEIEEIYVR
ncbi:MAG: type II toxin-antitoxin system RelE/ParE family toxin [Candidatus Poribacteria bacterium]|nr:type II toxin-antitoxin system RelE/ParE family toxin [Candidatus Poribacteria bacterium]